MEVALVPKLDVSSSQPKSINPVSLRYEFHGGSKYCRKLMLKLVVEIKY